MRFDFLAHLQDMWQLISTSPLTAALLVAVGIFMAKLYYGRQITTITAISKLAEKSAADYKDKLSGASPDEAKAKISALEDTINATIGGRWSPLGRDEVRRLRIAIAPLTKRRIQVMYVNQLGKELAQSFADVFEDLGWTVLFSEGGGLGVGVGTGRGNGMALTLKKVIEDCTKHKVTSFGPEENDTPDIVFVSVGIKPVS